MEFLRFSTDFSRKKLSTKTLVCGYVDNFENRVAKPLFSILIVENATSYVKEVEYNRARR